MSWSVLQSNGANADGMTGLLTYLSNLSSGTKLIAAVQVYQGTTTSVTDGNGNNFTKIQANAYTTSQDHGELSVWALDTPAGDVGTKPTVTVTTSFGGTAWTGAMVIQEVSGLATGYTVDGTPAISSGTISSNGSVSTGTYSTTAAGEYLLAAYSDDEYAQTTVGTPTGSTTYTLDAHSQNFTFTDNCCLAYGNSSNGTETCSFPLTGVTTTIDWATVIVAFPLASSGVGTVVVVPPAQPGRTWLHFFHHPQQLPQASQATTAPPAYPPAEAAQRRQWPRAVQARRARLLLPVPSQDGPLAPVSQRRQAWPWAVPQRRSRPLSVVPPQLNPPYPVAGGQRRQPHPRALARRLRAFHSVPVQDCPLPAPGQLRRVVRAMYLMRGHAFPAAPSQAAPVLPPFISQPLPRLRRVLAARRARPAAVITVQDSPLPQAQRRPRLPYRRPGRVVTPVSPQLNPTYPWAALGRRPVHPRALPRRSRVAAQPLSQDMPFAQASRYVRVVLRRSRGAVPLVPAQEVPVLQQAPRRPRAVPRRAGHAVTPVPPQLNPPYPASEIRQQRQPRGLWPRRGRQASPVPPQQAALPNPPITFQYTRHQRVLYAVRGRQASPVSPQAAAPVPVLVPQPARRVRLSALVTRRRQAAPPVPLQDTVLSPVHRRPATALGSLRRRGTFVPGQDVVPSAGRPRRFAVPVMLRGRVRQPVASQDSPLLRARHAAVPVVRRSGRMRPPVPPQVVVPAPPMTFQVLRRVRAWLVRRVLRGAPALPLPTVAPPLGPGIDEAALGGSIVPTVQWGGTITPMTAYDGSAAPSSDYGGSIA